MPVAGLEVGEMALGDAGVARPARVASCRAARARTRDRFAERDEERGSVPSAAEVVGTAGRADIERVVWSNEAAKLHYSA